MRSQPKARFSSSSLSGDAASSDQTTEWRTNSPSPTHRFRAASDQTRSGRSGPRMSIRTLVSTTVEVITRPPQPFEILVGRHAVDIPSSPDAGRPGVEILEIAFAITDLHQHHAVVRD